MSRDIIVSVLVILLVSVSIWSLYYIKSSNFKINIINGVILIVATIVAAVLVYISAMIIYNDGVGWISILVIILSVALVRYVYVKRRLAIQSLAVGVLACVVLEGMVKLIFK